MPGITIRRGVAMYSISVVAWFVGSEYFFEGRIDHRDVVGEDALEVQIRRTSRRTSAEPG